MSSPRDICVFCATRQLAVDVPTSSAVTQRRQLNSSSRAPQSAEAILYKDERDPPRPMSQAERMRQQLAASSAYAPPMQPQGGYTSPAQRMRASLGSQAPQNPQFQAQRQPQSDRRPPPSRGGVFNGPGRNQSRDKFAPATRKGSSKDGYTTFQPNRYKVNTEARPQVSTPSFNSTHLRRRNDPMADMETRAGGNHKPVVARPSPNRKMLDQDEIAKLLSNNSNNTRTTKLYQPLTRNLNTKRKCFHCGSLDHLSYHCPDKPVLRQEYTPRRTQPRAPESTADAAQAWREKVAENLTMEQPSQAIIEEDNRRRKADQDRRRARFELDEPKEVKNRYEQPARRQGGTRGRGRRIADEEEEESSRAIDRAERKRQRKEAKKAAQLEKAEPTPIQLPEYISVVHLASMLKVRVEDFVAKLEELGFEEVQNDHILNAEHAGLVAQEYNFEPIFLGEEEDGDLYPAAELSPEEYSKLPARPPVVTIMGHVDHGKTTILDYMRSTSVAASEFGGITQHIGAFSVPLASGKKITFLDTPGHSAFETMRARGANVTDIVVLVVAADDSVMPQTVEAIKHAQAAKVPMIVAINKIDKQQADPDAVKLDLGRHGIEIEDFGGDVQTVCVSGKTGQGIPELEEAISTLSEMLDHRADADATVEGWVLEGSTKKSGRVATVLVRRGTLRQGSTIVAGTTWARIRRLRNEAGVDVEEAGPGIAVEVEGWRDQPIAGDEVLEAQDEQQASSVTELRTEKVEREQMARDMKAINESRRDEADRRLAEEEAERAAAAGEDALEAIAKERGPEVVSFIVKGDVSGSVEAVIDSVSALGNGEVSTRILRHGVGFPSEFDVQHAAAAKGHIINFNTAIPNHVQKLAEEKGVKILDSNIIYRVVENVKDLLSEKLAPTVIQKVTGEAEIAAVFEIGIGGRKTLRVAGSKVRNGVVDRGTKARVLRGEAVVHDGMFLPPLLTPTDVL